jgi:prepilin-type processing-associated H-X9-DG protein
MTNVTTTAAESLGHAEPVPQRRSGPHFLVWAVGIIVVGGMMISILLPSLCRSSGTANRVKCASNLRQIGQAIALYAQKNGGQYPPSLAVLPGQEEIGAEVLTCPSSNDEKASAADIAGVVAELTAAETNAPGHKHCLSYVYTGRGLTVATASATSVVVYEPLDNHGGDGTNVLFGDGHVEFQGKQEWPKLAAAAGVPVISSLTTRP